MCIQPGNVVLLMIKNRTTKDKTYPIYAMVQSVRPGVLIVSEYGSRNGLATIVVHSESAQKGEYWYEYYDFQNQGHSEDVCSLFVNGIRLVGDKFTN